MDVQRAVPALLLAVGGLSLWLLVAGPATVLGVDSGNAGVALLVTVAWTSLYAVSRMPRGALEQRISPGEWKAWIGVGFMLVAIGYFLAHLDAFAGVGETVGSRLRFRPEATRVARNLVLLLVAWSVLQRVLGSRWKGAVETDERDAQIATLGSAWGYGALKVYVVVFAVMLGFSPAHRLGWATHFMIGNLLILGLMWGLLMEHLSRAVQYWRDRA